MIGAVYEIRQGNAHRILRKRLLTSALENDIDRSVTKVAASRISFAATTAEPNIIWLDDIADQLSFTYTPLARIGHDIAGTALEIATLLKQTVVRLPVDMTSKRATRDRPVAAAVLDETGLVRLAARNTAGRNKTRHAEINLVSLAQQAELVPFSAGWTVVTTLSPCKMCAAALLHSFACPEDATILYLEHDPGRLARDTVLDQFGRAFGLY